MWNGVCGMTYLGTLGASPGKMSVIPGGTGKVGEVIIQTFGVIDVGMLTLLNFLILVNFFSKCWPCPRHIMLIHKLVDWQVVKAVCLDCKIAHWPFYMF